MQIFCSSEKNKPSLVMMHMMPRAKGDELTCLHFQPNVAMFCNTAIET